MAQTPKAEQAIAEQVKRAQASAAELRAEAAQLREAGEDLEDAEMLRAAKRLEAQARKTEQTIARAQAVRP
jgi:hypothetical protein